MGFQEAVDMPEARAKAREVEPRRKDESIDEKKHRKAVVKDAKVGLHTVRSGAVWGLTQANAGAHPMASQWHQDGLFTRFCHCHSHKAWCAALPLQPATANSNNASPTHWCDS